MNNKLLPIYILGNIATFIYLMVTDWRDIDGFIDALFFSGINEFLAAIWPVYWGILHWIH